MMINDVNVPKLHNRCDFAKSKVNVQNIATIPTNKVSICGVLNIG